jgi:hypothetical protein
VVQGLLSSLGQSVSPLGRRLIAILPLSPPHPLSRSDHFFQATRRRIRRASVCSSSSTFRPANKLRAYSASPQHQTSLQTFPRILQDPLPDRLYGVRLQRRLLLFPASASAPPSDHTCLQPPRCRFRALIYPPRTPPIIPQHSQPPLHQFQTWLFASQQPAKLGKHGQEVVIQRRAVAPSMKGATHVFRERFLSANFATFADTRG